MFRRSLAILEMSLARLAFPLMIECGTVCVVNSPYLRYRANIEYARSTTIDIPEC